MNCEQTNANSLIGEVVVAKVFSCSSRIRRGRRRSVQGRLSGIIAERTREKCFEASEPVQAIAEKEPRGLVFITHQKHWAF